MKIVHVVGARPNFMKIAPTHAALESWADVAQRIIHTGQHYDPWMSEAHVADLEMPEPDYFLGAGSGTHAVQTARILEAIEPILEVERPDAVVVAGDTNSAMAAALAAVKLQLPVVHLEAGLRSRDRTMPEEHNRIIVDHVSDLLLTPSADADENLRAEGIVPDRIVLVGNTMIDSLRRFEQRARELDVARREFGVEEHVLVTLHRPSLVDDPRVLGEALDALDEIARRRPVLFPVHPRTQRVLDGAGVSPSGVLLVPPQPYLRFLSLLVHANAVVTDSGGIQEETTALGIPCFTLRANTERPVTISHGTNQLLGIGRDALARLRELVEAPRDQERRIPPLWDGAAAPRAAAAIVARYGTGARRPAALWTAG